jgi:FMN phosphatase YigB (HAD superfamily)
VVRPDRFRTGRIGCARIVGVLPTPRTLLLDFGGVIADGPVHPSWGEAIVAAVGEVLAGAGVEPVPAEAVLEPLTAAGPEEDRFWLAGAPTQPDHGSLWESIAAGWPAPARAVAVGHARILSYHLMQAKHTSMWELRTGMADLLADAHARGIPMAVVSNTLCGEPHREFLDRAGLAGRFAVQLYSDEQGVPKPNPEIAWRAVAGLGVSAADCWFVGDTLCRDVLVARRAGLGAAVLMRSVRVERPPHPEGVAPDAAVADPVELHALLAAHW